MKPVDRDLVERLLQDESLSFREIARRADCSDWSVRSIARDLAGGA
jgi:DNA-binding Lrp family transcriptional regulator